MLDTWFSSALWPFSTLGWPDKTPELAKFYPTAVLVTAFDIIFFWVARMMMMGVHFMGEVPFRTVLIHNRVLDEQGAKMSKTKGNVVDPRRQLMNRADALRFTWRCGQAEPRCALARRALGQAATHTSCGPSRFCEMNGCVTIPGFDRPASHQTVNQWIISETGNAVSDITSRSRSTALQ